MVTKTMLKNSIEAKWRKYNRNLFIVFFCLALLLEVFLSSYTFSTVEDFLKVVGITLLSTSPLLITLMIFTIYYGVKYHKTCEVLDDYKIYEVVLDQPSVSLWHKRSFYYEVTFVTAEKKTKTKDTPPLFGAAFFYDVEISDYNNKKIYIAYSNKEDRMIVLGKNLEEEY